MEINVLIGLRDYIINLEEVGKEMKDYIKLLKIRVFMVVDIMR